MSGIWQASVTHHSRLPEPLRHLLYLLADAANDAGIVDPAPNQETLATMAGCSSRTVRTRMAAIVQSGELEQTRVGAGPGNPSAYKFLLPLPPNMKPETKPEKGGNGTGRLDRLENELAQHALRISSLEARMTSVEQQLAALTTAVTELTATIKAEKGGNNHAVLSAFVSTKAEMKPEKGGKFDSENRKIPERKPENTGNETGKYRKGSVLNTSDDPILIHSSPGEDPPTPQPPQPAIVEPDKKRLADMVNALAIATGMSGHLNWTALSAFAQELISLGYTSEQVSRHYSRHPAANGSAAWNWHQHDWRGKKGEFPTVGIIRQTISGAVDWEPPPSNGNGHYPKAAVTPPVDEDWSTAPAPLSF